jgi:hypothetical protein
MQIRSFRGSGEPAWVNAYSNACLRLGPHPRRALGPAAIPAASTGRTRDRTRPMLQKRQKVLARAPSTRDPKRHFATVIYRNAERYTRSPHRALATICGCRHVLIHCRPSSSPVPALAQQDASLAMLPPDWAVPPRCSMRSCPTSGCLCLRQWSVGRSPHP